MTVKAIAAIAMLTIFTTACSSENNENNSASHLPAQGGPVGNGPFGLDLSLPFAKLDYDKKPIVPDKGIYAVTVPSPSPDFNNYLVKAYPEAGICGLLAGSKDFDGDSNGGKVRGAIDALAAAMETKYGKPTKKDICNGGEIFCAPENWAMSIMNGDRVYGYQWKNLKSDNQVRDVTLVVAATELAVLSIGATYEVNNKAKCEAAAKAASAKNL